jgi:hypothetical protein
MKISALIKTTKRTAQAGNNALWYAIPQRDYQNATFEIGNADEQTSSLLDDVAEALHSKLKLSSGEAEALSRVIRVVQNYRTWKPDLIRNNVFKAAHALGMKLPSAMF